MTERRSPLGDWTPEQIAIGRTWVATWKFAAIDLERIRREEIRSLDTFRSIELLCGPHDTPTT